MEQISQNYTECIVITCVLAKHQYQYWKGIMYACRHMGVVSLAFLADSRIFHLREKDGDSSEYS